MTAAMPDLLYSLGALLLAITGGGLLGWALLMDRSRGRRRCPRCWYLMEGVAGRVCPECGHDARDDRRLLRTRRRWRWAAVAVVLIAAAPVVSLWPRAARDGWMSLAPTWALGHLMVLGDPFEAEVLNRLGIGPQNTRLGFGPRNSRVALDADERARLLSRIVRGTVFARPPSGAWERSYGQFLRDRSFRLYQFTSGTLMDPIENAPASEALAAAVQAQGELPYRLTVRTRERWPVGVPVLIEAEVEHWWPSGMMDDAFIRWAVKGDGPKGEVRARGWFTAEVPLQGPVEIDVDVDVIQRNGMASPSESRSVGREVHRVAYTTVATVDEAIPQVSGPELDALVAAGVTAEFGIMLSLRPDGLKGGGVDDVGFGVLAEIMHGDEVVMTYPVRWLGGGVGGGGMGPIMHGAQADDWQAATLRVQADRGKSGWTVRLRSDIGEAIQLLDAKRAWEGEVTIPLTIR